MKQLLGAMVLVFLGCGGETLDVGDDGAGSGGGNSGTQATADLRAALQTQPICNDRVVDAPNANWPDPTACAMAATGTQSANVGVWEGYTEDSNFNPITPLRLELLAAAPGGPICGTIKYGAGALPPLSSDPAAFYPPLDSGYYPSVRAPFPTGSPQYWGMLTGATYTIASGGMVDNQLRFQVSAYEHYRGWCGLQSAYPSSGGVYACSPLVGDGNSGYWNGDEPDYCHLTVDGISMRLPAAQCSLCGAFNATVCTCDSCHCTARLETTHGFDLTFSGDTVTGLGGQYDGPSMPLPSPVSVRLKRVQ